jgi:hypothetical protein
VINPQDGHIVCDPYPATRGFSLRILWSSRITNSRSSRTKEKLVAFTKRPFLPTFCTKRHVQTTRCAEKPKVGELQMDCLRSEDLNEEKT